MCHQKLIIVAINCIILVLKFRIWNVSISPSMVHLFFVLKLCYILLIWMSCLWWQAGFGKLFKIPQEILCRFKRSLFASHLTEHFHFAESVWKLVMRLFLGMKPIAVLYSSRINTYLPIVVSFSLRTVTYRSSSRAFVSKVTHVLTYRRNIVKLLSNAYTFEKARGSLFKYIEKRGVVFVLKSNQQVYKG